MINHGLHCIGCGGAAFESLEDGCIGHGIDTKDVNKMVNEINEL